MINVAILGFGVVGGGVADLLTNNGKETERLSGEKVNIKYILDLRDFPNSPFGDKVVHDYSIIVNDPEVDIVIEAMGGSHPAYEYTVAALKAKKSVITSNKEVVANFGDEFLALARENGVAYRFEAAVGGGIPVISPLISCVCQNKINEICGILNGTTNFILTEMLTKGKSFDDALADAQSKGYAEANPAADVEGTDAARKIVILAAIVTGKLLPVSKIHVEGITKIRNADVNFATGRTSAIKLLGRAVNGDELTLLVSPFVVPKESPIKNVMGVFNAVSVSADPLGDVMFYGQGAGAGATASAVVGDLMQIITTGNNYPMPVFKKVDSVSDFGEFECSHYLAFSKMSDSLSENLPVGSEITVNGSEIAVITPKIKERELDAIIDALEEKPLSNIRFYEI